MDLIPLGLILSGLLALPAAAAGSSPATALVRLDQVLTQALQDKAQGRLAPDRWAEFVAKFRTDLASAKAAAPPTAASMALYTHIRAKLDENNRNAVAPAATLGSVDSRSAVSRTHFEEKTTPAAIAEEKAILESEPFNEGRREPGEWTVAAAPQQTRKIRFLPGDQNTLPFEPSVKIPPAAAPPSLAETQSSNDTSPLPLFPLAVAAGLGAAAYGVSRSKAAYDSKDGLDDAHPIEPGPYQRLVANTILAGAAGGVIYLAGAAAITAVAPFALRYAAPVIQQGVRLAGSEAGAINPSLVDIDVAPETEAGAAEAQQVVLERGERGLHLFKFRNPASTIASGWEKGDRFLYLPNRGSPTANWDQNSRVLRLAMRVGKPIYDSYIDALTGKQIPTRGFLNAERNLLENHGWTFNPQTGAYHSPVP